MSAKERKSVLLMTKPGVGDIDAEKLALVIGT